MKLPITKTYLLAGICLAFCGLLLENAYSRPITPAERISDGAAARPFDKEIHKKKLAPPPAIFTTQPQNQTACDGNTATFTAIYSASTTFKWQQSDDEAFTSPVDLTTAGAYQINSTSTSSTLQIISTLSLSGKYYRCVADPTGTTILSNKGTLTVSPLTTISYGASPLVVSSGNANVTLIGSPGGVYSASPAGLTLDASTGAINTNSSTRGTYLVTYTVTAPAACPSYVVPPVTVKIQTATRTFTWTGATDGDWNTLGNWLENSTVPAVLPTDGSEIGDDVIIPVIGTEVYPIISSTAKARSITIAAGATLDITTAGNLTITAAGLDGITNNGKFTNEGTVVVNASYRDGFVNTTGASLINKKTLTISDGTGTRLKNSSWIENFSSSTITINGGLETGVINNNNATIKNQGTFTVNNGSKGALYNEGTINNLSSFTTTGGNSESTVVNMDTLSNQANATFTFGSGKSTALDNANYLYNAGTFTNSSGTNNDDAHPAIINRENATFLNTSTANTSFTAAGYDALVFKNDGYLESSSPLTIKNSNKGLLVNNVKGVIVNNAALNLTNCNADAFTNHGKFTNSATGTLKIESSGGYQIINNGVFTSATGCTLNFNKGTKGVKNNNNGNFTNKCITSFGAQGSAVVENLGTYIHDAGSISTGGLGSAFNNQDTMQINVPIAITRGMDQLIINSGIFTVGVNTVVSLDEGVRTGQMITNSSTGTFNSDGTFTNNACSGIINNAGTMTLGTGSKITGTNMGKLITNSGTLTNEGKLSFRMGGYVVDNSLVFTNKGTITSGNTRYGIHNYNGATFENSGTMTIDSVENHGIHQEDSSGNSFTNTTTGKISINYTVGNGILNSQGTFTNNGKLLIGNAGIKGISLAGINNAGTFQNTGLVRIGDAAKITLNAISNTGIMNNGTGGKIYLRNADGSGIDNQGGAINNQACAAIESQMAIVNTSGTFLNAGLIHKLTDTKTAVSNIGGNSGYVLNDDVDAFTYIGSNGPPPPTMAITSSDGVLYTGQIRALTATPADGVFDVTGPATLDGSTLTATGIGTIVVSYTINSFGCSYAATQIIEPMRISKISSRPPGCNDATGSITVTTSGIGTFEYSKDGENWQNSPTFTGLTVGSYTISARVVATPDYPTTIRETQCP